MNEHYTPRVWETYTAHDGSRNICAGVEFVCQFGRADATPESRQRIEADGRLIAVAPRLLAALIGLRRIFLTSEPGKPPNDDDFAAAMDAAAVAIAKATGGPA